MKGRFLVCLFSFIMVFSACAQPDAQALKEAGQTVDTAAHRTEGEAPAAADSAAGQDLSGETDPEDSGMSAPGQIPEGNGTHIKEVIGEGEYTFDLDAAVSIPDSPPQEGIFEIQDVDLSLFEENLCGGMALTEDTSEPLAKRYLSEDGSKRLTVYMDQPGLAFFSNSSLDVYYSDPELMYKSSSEMTEDEKEVLTQMEEEAAELMAKMGYEGEVVSFMYSSAGETRYCNLSLSSKINGYPLIRDNYYCLNSVSIGNYGTGSVTFHGFYKIGQASDVAVLSLDEIMAIVRDGVAQKNINTYNVPVTKVQLAYMVQWEESSQASFYPVWCFAGEWDEDTGPVPFLILDARTGDVVSMAETY